MGKNIIKPIQQKIINTAQGYDELKKSVAGEDNLSTYDFIVTEDFPYKFGTADTAENRLLASQIILDYSNKLYGDDFVSVAIRGDNRCSHRALMAGVLIAARRLLYQEDKNNAYALLDRLKNFATDLHNRIDEEQFCHLKEDFTKEVYTQFIQLIQAIRDEKTTITELVLQANSDFSAEYSDADPFNLGLSCLFAFIADKGLEIQAKEIGFPKELLSDEKNSKKYNLLEPGAIAPTSADRVAFLSQLDAFARTLIGRIDSILPTITKLNIKTLGEAKNHDNAAFSLETTENDTGKIEIFSCNSAGHTNLILAKDDLTFMEEELKLYRNQESNFLIRNSSGGFRKRHTGDKNNLPDSIGNHLPRTSHHQAIEDTNKSKTPNIQMKKIKPFLVQFNSCSSTDAEDQARKILDEAKFILEKNTNLPGVAITYSANLDQANKIKETYAKGKWDTGTNGSNQAAVINKIETLLQTEKCYYSLREKFHILPITTCQKAGGIGEVATHQIEDDLKNVVSHIRSGWQVLGWQNQDTVAFGKFAVGGSISKQLTEAQNNLTQNSLRHWVNNLPNASGNPLLFSEYPPEVQKDKTIEKRLSITTATGNISPESDFSLQTQEPSSSANSNESMCVQQQLETIAQLSDKPEVIGTHYGKRLEIKKDSDLEDWDLVEIKKTNNLETQKQEDERLAWELAIAEVEHQQSKKFLFKKTFKHFKKLLEYPFFSDSGVSKTEKKAEEEKSYVRSSQEREIKFYAESKIRK